MEPRAYSYVRFSTPEQSKGDSLRRQKQGVEEIAKQLGLPLDDELHLTDAGISSYTGDNRTKGALGEFLKMIDENKIAVGSCLIIEQFDRLTRQGMAEAIHLLTGIILKGIDIYTKIDGKHFTKETFNATDLIISAINLEQGNLYSKNLSFRLRKAYEGKRAKAVSGKRKMTKGCPMWLEPTGYWESERKFITTGFKPIPERVAVIKLIYEMKLTGKGSDRIVKELNQMRNIWKPEGKMDKKKETKRPDAWNTSTVDLYLKNNRRLLGELQLYRYEKQNGKRVNIPDGDPILDYYPAVIETDLFNQVQENLRANARKKGRGGGRSDKVNNLFSHIAVCSRCGTTMYYLNKGHEYRTSDQIKCYRAVRGLPCNSSKLHYLDVERNVLQYCKGLDVSDILPNSEKTASELSVLSKQLQAKDGELTLINDEIEGNLASKRVGKSVAYLKALEHAFDSLYLRKQALEKERQDIQDKIKQLTDTHQQTQEQLKSIKELIDLMHNLRKDKSKEQELINIRLSLRNQLRHLINKVEINTENKQVNIYFKTGERRMVLARPAGEYKIKYRDFKSNQ